MSWADATLRGTCLVAAIAVLAPAGVVVERAAHAQSGIREVPTEADIGSLVANYHRLRPQIATGGLLQPGAPARLKALGFATIVDLRGPEEGTAAERREVEAAGLRYVNIPVTEGLPSDAQLTALGRIIADSASAPLLIHCVSANRVGAAWALYRAKSGTPLATAIAEGRTIGMKPVREADVRKRLQAVPAGVAADTRCEPGRC